MIFIKIYFLFIFFLSFYNCKQIKNIISKNINNIDSSSNINSYNYKNQIKSNNNNKIIQPIVTYISFTTNINQIYYKDINQPFSNSKNNKNENQIYLNASLADDTPLYSIQLAQVFPYFGQYVDRVYVSPNGFIQMTPNPECNAFYCDPCHATYHGSIAGFVADLGPFINKNSSISYIQSNTSIIIDYNEIPDLHTKKHYFSFQIELLNDGTIIILYRNLSSAYTSSVTSTCEWFTGLVPPKDYNISSIITSDQKSISLNQWKRNTSGIYPSSRSSIKTNSIFISCPITTTWCLKPAVISSSSIPKILNLTTLSMSCFNSTGFSYVDWAITLSTQSSIKNKCYLFLHPKDTSSSSSSSTNENLSPATLQCVLDSTVQSSLTNNGGVTINIYWKPVNSESYTLLNDVSLTLTIQTSTPSSLNNCILNTEKSVGICSACQVCSGNISSCSSPTCDITLSKQSTISTFPNYDYPYNSFYIQPSCYMSEVDSCLNSFNLIYDSKNKCCDVDNIDCLGICDGDAEPGIRSEDNALICCDEEVDCKGICGGKSYIDACGVCGGTDTGQKCPTYVNIFTNNLNSPNKLLPKYYPTNQTDNSQSITIQNNGNTSLLVTFKVSSEHVNYDPLISIPKIEYEIIPHTTQTFYISTNISRIFSKIAPTWEVKTVIVK